MKIIFKYLCPLVLTLLAVSCAAGLEDHISEDLEIRLGIGVPGSVISVKSGPVDYDTFLPDNISLIRWDEGGRRNPADYTFDEAINATIGQPDASDQWKRYVNFETSQYFVDRTKAVGFAACYPSVKESGLWKKDKNVLTYNIHEGRDVDVMVSDFKSGTYTSGLEPLEFQHALCLYNIYVYAVDEQAAASWGNIENITFINLPEELYVTLPDDMTSPDASVSFSYSPKPADNVYEPLDLFDAAQNIPLPVGINNRAKIGYILGGPPAIGLLGVSAKTVTQDEATSPVSIARNFQPGYIYNLLLRFSGHGVMNAEVTVEEWKYDGGEYSNPYYAEMENASKFLTNLSRYGTSNSYIAASGNMGYCFNATVKGNGVNVLTDWEGKTYAMPDASAALAPAYVGVVHSDVLLKYDGEKYVPTTEEEKHSLELIKLRSKNLVDGHAMFDIAGVEGASETDYTLPYMGNAVIAAYNVYDEIIWSWHIWVTDRPYNVNYGNGYVAHDRNLGACSVDEENSTAAQGLDYQWGRKDPIFPDDATVEGPLTMAESHSNPVKAVTSTTDDWLKNNYDYLWGYVAERMDVRKTMYDPCPQGYRVSDSHTFQNITGNVVEGTNGKTYEIGEYDIYFPNAENGYPELYSATPVSAGNSYAYRLDGSFSAVSAKRMEKMNVRCVAENSRPVVHNLDENQSANCHLITEPGYYRFDAKTLGNGVRGFNVVMNQGNISPQRIDNSYNPSTVDRVEVLAWQGDITTGSNFRSFAEGNPSPEEIEKACPVRVLDNGKLTDGNAYYFISNDTFAAGNVILAGYDTNNQIVWSWHLWMVPGGVGEEKWGRYMVLDRNVGATWRPSAPGDVKDDNYRASVGFYYQWGRKDPFPMPKDDSDELYVPVFIKTIDGTWSRQDNLRSQEAGTIDESVGAPLAYFKKNTADKANGNYWQTSWCDVNGANRNLPLRNIWGYTGVEGATGDTFVKTMWDPCPAGYKVGSHEVVFGWNVGANTDNRQNIQASSTSWEYGIFYEGTDQKWLPKSGRINEEGVLKRPETYVGYLNSSCPYANGSVYRGMYYYVLNGQYYIGQSQESNECYAVPVRCVRE